MLLPLIKPYSQPFPITALILLFVLAFVRSQTYSSQKILFVSTLEIGLTCFDVSDVVKVAYLNSIILHSYKIFPHMRSAVELSACFIDVLSHDTAGHR